ncbi:hypothetical protein HK104_004216 [Borealophlyctis nickersoniae]|nr:hypothetical protein HK104_004216 [Borealophlyctis nickersoniae]
MSLLAAIIFIMVAYPLAQLARAMKTLTNLDFASLEKSKVLENRSLLLEARTKRSNITTRCGLYNVQVTFSTMVKAFAGGIKKNKEMMTRTTAQGGSASKSTAATGSTV